MADYTVLDPDGFLQGRPITGSQGQALEENLRAVAEGAPGAPPIQTRALEGGNYIGRVAQSGTSPTGFLDLDDFDELDIFVSTQNSSTGNRQLEIRFGDIGGSGYGAWQGFLPNTGASSSSSFSGKLSLVSGRVAGLFNASTVTYNFSVPAGNVNAFQIRGDGGAFTYDMVAYASTGKTL